MMNAKSWMISLTWLCSIRKFPFVNSAAIRGTAAVAMPTANETMIMINLSALKLNSPNKSSISLPV